MNPASSSLAALVRLHIDTCLSTLPTVQAGRCSHPSSHPGDGQGHRVFVSTQHDNPRPRRWNFLLTVDRGLWPVIFRASGFEQGERVGEESEDLDATLVPEVQQLGDLAQVVSPLDSASSRKRWVGQMVSLPAVLAMTLAQSRKPP